MNANNPIRILILNDSRDEANRLVSMLNNAGKTTDAQHVESEEALIKLLQERHWDLLIAHADTANLPPEQALKQIRKLNKDVPLLLLTEEEGSPAIVEGLKKGAVDVLLMDEDQHLLQVIQRELENREHRQQSRFALRKLKEVERRNQQLLDSSKDAIAFVEDGMFLYTNDSFAQLLGYPSRDELECTPIIDAIAPGDQDMLRDFLKDVALKHNTLDTQVLAFNVVMQSGDTKTLTVDISLASFDESTCVQLLIPGAAQSLPTLSPQQMIKPAAPEQVTSSESTVLIDRTGFLAKLQKALSIAVEKEQTGSVMCIQAPDYILRVLNKVGASSADRVTKTLTGQIKQWLPEGAIATQWTEGVYVILLPQAHADSALAHAKRLSQQLREYYVDIDGSSLQFQFFVGASLFSETTTSPDAPILQALKACEIAKEQPNELAKLFEPDAKDQAIKVQRNDKDIERLLHKALENGRFKLLYQPILSLRGSTQEHYEVLVRMLDSKGDEITPDDFMETAQRIGLSAKMDRWIILDALKTLSKHRASGHNTRLIINLSVDSMRDKTLPEWLAIAFKAAKLPSDSLVFQMSESEVSDHITQAKLLSEKLAELGSAVCINRFGTHANPLNALHHVAAKYIKLDGSYTQDLQNTAGQTERFNQLVTELHTLDKVTIVPFVESASVLSKLWQSGVHYIQGYYLQAPADSMNFVFDSEM